MMFPSAIQILTAVAGIITLNPHNNAPSLRDVFLAEDVEDLPILVFSITGKTRGGKSFLLNSMIQYLEANGEQGWWKRPIPNAFDWKGGTESVTRGLWIFPKIYKRNVEGKKVGILFLDNQGLFDGTQSDGESIVISGISTGLSYLQMFNLKEKITSDDLLNIHMYLVDGMDKAELKSTSTTFMFVVRDFIGSEDFGTGLMNGINYINKEKEMMTQEHKDKWQSLHNAFSGVGCLLLPHPGTKITTKNFKENGSLRDLDEEFVSELDSFFRTLFAPKNLNPKIDTPTGRSIYEILNKLNGRKADNIQSFFQMFTEEGNEHKLEKLTEQFKERVLFKGDDLDSALKLKTELEHTGRNLFKGNTVKDYSTKLEKRLEEILNNRVKQHIVTLYSEALGSTAVERNHRSHWPVIRMSLERFVCGPIKRNIISEIVENLAEKYYNRLSLQLYDDFKNQCTLYSCNKNPKIFEKSIDFETAGGTVDVLKRLWERVKSDFDHKVGAHKQHIQNRQEEERRAEQRERNRLEMQQARHKQESDPSSMFTGFVAGVGTLGAAMYFVPNILPAFL